MLFGHSEFAGNIGVEDERVGPVIAELLRERFPGEEIEVRTTLWNYLWETTIEAHLAKIERYQPDYLVLVPAVHWVTFMDLAFAIENRAPAGFRKFSERLVELDYRLTRRSERSGRWAAALYRRPLSRVARAVVGIAPRYTPPQALDVVERFVQAGLRNESTEVMLVGGTTLAALQTYMADRDSASCDRIFPPQNMPLLERFILDLVELSRRRHVKLIDHWRVPVLDLMADRLHIGRRTKRMTAEMIVAAIVESERAYHRSGPPTLQSPLSREP
jgi:hypothetical protein